MEFLAWSTMSEMTTYILLTGLLTLAAILVLQYGLKTYRQKREKGIDEIQKINPVLTESPFDEPGQWFRWRAKKGLKARFSIFNRVIYTSLIMVAISMVTFPYIDKFPQTVVSILITSTTIIIGIAGKPLIENFLSGVVISFSKKIRIGDTVLVDQFYGTIEDITATNTVIKLWDWRRLVIPNHQMLNQKVVSYTLFDDWHWAHVEFMVSPHSDLKKVKEVAIQIARDNQYSEKVEEPSFWVMEAHSESIKCWLAVWAKSPARSWELRSEILTELTIRLNEMGIRTHINHLKFEQPAKLF